MTITTTISAPIDIDARAVFLARASARHTLFEAGEIPLEEAFDELIEPFMAIVGQVFTTCDVCGAAPCRNESFCQACRRTDRLKRSRR